MDKRTVWLLKKAIIVYCLPFAILIYTLVPILSLLLSIRLDKYLVGFCSSIILTLATIINIMIGLIWILIY